MTPAKKDSPPQEKSSTAKPEPQSGGGEVHSDDWREQTDPHPQPPGTGAAPAKAPAGRVMPPQTYAAPTPPGAPYAAGNPVVVTPYRAPGKAPFFMVGQVLVGSEEDAAMTLKNQLFLPSIPPVLPPGP